MSTWKGAQIISLQGNENYKYNEMPLILNKKAKTKEMTVPSIGELVGQVELSYIAPGCIKWYNHFGKIFNSLF